MLLLTITLHDTTMLRFIFMTVFHWYICICILNCTVKPCQRGGGLNPHFIFRYCGTIKGFNVAKVTVFSEWTAFTCSVYRAWSVLPLIPYRKRSWCFSSLYLHQNVALTFFFCTFKMHISFCQRTSAFYSWSSILFILPDLYPFRYLVITVPC